MQTEMFRDLSKWPQNEYKHKNYGDDRAYFVSAFNQRQIIMRSSETFLLQLIR
jgi:hypothetical protein